MKDENIARKIVSSISDSNFPILEIGPGTGVLSKYLFAEENRKVFLIEVDRESHEHLVNEFPEKKDQIIEGDFLNYDLSKLFSSSFSIIGNFPYNISSQILFRVLEYRSQVKEVVGMFQKEVADRIISSPGNKKYGILSVLIQAFYDCGYLFTVNQGVFHPPPKVKSAVIRLRRNNLSQLPCNETLFFSVVKTAFNQRRKTLRNSLKLLNIPDDIKQKDIFNLRPEQLGFEEFVELTNLLSSE